RAVTLAVEAGTRVGKRDMAVTHATRMAFFEQVRAGYPNDCHDGFFQGPAPASPTLLPVRTRGRRQVHDAVWASSYQPFWTAFADRYRTVPQSPNVTARLFSTGEPRPIAVLLHGYMSGHFAVEERIWPLNELDELGFDTALFVLPFHGPRAAPGRSLQPEFPSGDPRMTIEGFRQAVTDLRAFVRFLRERGHPRVGLLGMSLGGYVAALTATLEPELDFLVPIIPLASLSDFAREQGSLSAEPAARAREHTALDRLYRVVSPLGRPPLITGDRVLVLGARADRVTPIEHARALSAHFQARLLAWPGGHLLQIGRKRSFESVYALLDRVR
ncbi:MAG TPA: hypothetical protein VFQ61_16995, partial [Polyangiaceae bacterium]|nr:hypothetical protein [Polyangiaceae bacterium]